MKITSEDLAKYQACGQGLDFIKQTYPNGAEIMDIINNPDTPLHVLHWGYMYVSVADDEIQAYRKRCNIDENSRFIWFSENIENSMAVSNSHSIIDSKYVTGANNVKSSQEIYDSKQIDHCHEIISSTEVKYSDLVWEADRVEESKQVVCSKDIKWSQFVVRSTNIEDSQFIYCSENSYDCYFGGFLENCRHCLFCSGLADAEYYIFNKKVAPAVFEEWKEKLLFQIQAENPKILEITQNKHTINERYHFNNRLDAMLSSLSSDLYGWIGTIPYYDELVFLSLFFKENNLKNS